jgi:hypothetical protein
MREKSSDVDLLAELEGLTEGPLVDAFSSELDENGEPSLVGRHLQDAMNSLVLARLAIQERCGIADLPKPQEGAGVLTPTDAWRRISSQGD